MNMKHTIDFDELINIHWIPWYIWNIFFDIKFSSFNFILINLQFESFNLDV